MQGDILDRPPRCRRRSGPATGGQSLQDRKELGTLIQKQSAGLDRLNRPNVHLNTVTDSPRKPTDNRMSTQMTALDPQQKSHRPRQSR
jgi:hypothetical protein